jgi:hypothetical protein
MKRFLITVAALLALTGQAQAAEFAGFMALEGRYFTHAPLMPEQDRQDGSLVLEPEFYHAWGENSVTFRPFGRLDSADPERSHWDVRELFVQFVFEEAELSIGARKVFWGVAESQHLVDVINQTDLIESPDSEDKLGQPMVMLTIPSVVGTFDFFVMPFFRERTFPGPKGRLHGPLFIDTDLVTYESSMEQFHPDAAVRLSHFFGELEFGLSHFYGTSREPTLTPGLDGLGRPVLKPFYPLIHQSGLDVQLIAGEMLWKFEGIRRSGQGRTYWAWTGGFEYTFVGFLGSRMDLGVIGEWLRDTRGKLATTPFDNDLMAGLRLAVNDMQSTEILVGGIFDPNTGARLASIEASRRIGDNFRLEVEGYLFSNLPPQDAFFGFNSEDFIRLSLAYYF